MPEWLLWTLIGLAFLIALTIHHNIRTIGQRVEEEISVLKEIRYELEKANRRFEPND